MKVTFGVLLSMLLVVCSCSSSPKVGGTCTTSAQCDPELQCVPIYGVQSPGCSAAHPIGMVCSLSCQSSSDCASLGGGFACVTTGCPGVPGYCAAQ